MPRKLDPIPPGEVLKEEFVLPLGISQRDLADHLGVPTSRIVGILSGARAITADMALRLSTYFGTSAEMWLRLQADYDLRVAREREGAEIERVVRRRAG